MRIFLFGTGAVANDILMRIDKIPTDIEILGFIDNDSQKWGKIFWGKTVYAPNKLLDTEFDQIIVMSDIFFNMIKKDLIYWYGIDCGKIKDQKYLLKLLLTEKYKRTKDVEIQAILKYWDENEISVYNQYVQEEIEMHTVYLDRVENLPYILFEDKRMYFPYNYKFQEYNGRKVVTDITAEQQWSSPHLYIRGDIKIERGDVIADAGVQEGNFALRYIEKVSKAYLFECNKVWIKPLQKTFEKFKDKVILNNSFLGQFHGGMYSNLDTVIKGKLDFLKMDIEGAEVEALLGGKRVLLNNNVKCAICSYHKSEQQTAIEAILRYYGYETCVSDGYMVFYKDKNIYTSLDFRRGIVYAKKKEIGC
ncbi:MAG: FkbM family methyltransferase [Lachnospiraceae bacterium]|nr:FkbM family methyltransferase [Lachnospiraceae bacterium]